MHGGAFWRTRGRSSIGTAQGGSCFGASYEFLFNVRHRIKKAGLEDVAPVTFVTAEPFLGHFGLGGVGGSEKLVERFFGRYGIEGLPNTVIKEVRDGEIELESGRVLPFAYSMIVPPFAGVDAVARSRRAGQPDGVHARRRAIPPPRTPATCSRPASRSRSPRPTRRRCRPGVPKTGQMTETMAKVAAHNIAADLDGTPSAADCRSRISARSASWTPATTA